MHLYRLYMVVQDSSGLFLGQSESGDVMFVEKVTQAGRFEDLEVATDSAETHCGEGYVIFPFYQRVPAGTH